MRETRRASHQQRAALPIAVASAVHGLVGMDSSSLSFAQLPLLLCLAVVITGGLVAAIFRHRQRAATALAMQRAAAPAPGKIIYSDAPTVRVSDSHRVDRRRRIVRLTAGE